MIKIKLLRARFLGSKGFDSACLLPSAFLPHLLLLLTSQIHFSPVFLLVVYPPSSTTVSRISRCFIFYTYLVVPSVARGFYLIYLLIHHPNPFLFFISHQSSESQQVSNLLVRRSIPYKNKSSNCSKQSRIHSQLQLPIPFSSNELLSSLKIQPSTIKLSQGWFYTHDFTPKFTFEVRKVLVHRLATCCVDNLPVILLLRIDICRPQIPTFN
jgi:hypothetical protein